MQPAEMVDRQREHGGQYVGRGLRQRALLRVFEHVIGNAIGLAQALAVDRRELGEVFFGRGAVGGVAGGRIVADPVGIAEIAAEEGRYRIAIEHFCLAPFEQRMQAVRRLFRGRYLRVVPRMVLRARGGCGGKRGGHGQRRGQPGESDSHA